MFYIVEYSLNNPYKYGHTAVLNKGRRVGRATLLATSHPAAVLKVDTILNRDDEALTKSKIEVVNIFKDTDAVLEQIGLPTFGSVVQGIITRHNEEIIEDIIK